LVHHSFQSRAVFSCTSESLMDPLTTRWDGSTFDDAEDSVIVGTFQEQSRSATDLALHSVASILGGTGPAYLHRINVPKLPDCPFCPGTKKTFTHFACICPKLHDARTAAHNQVRTLITLLLSKCLLDRWKLHEETPMGKTARTIACCPHGGIGTEPLRSLQ
jgi:hypothetical protein